MKIRRSGRFENELGEIIDYIAKDKKSADKAFNRNLQSAIEALIDNPIKVDPPKTVVANSSANVTRFPISSTVKI